METSRFLLTAYVKFPQVQECDMLIAPYVRNLIENHWHKMVSDNHNTSSTTVLVELCQDVVHSCVSHIMEAISPVVSDWLIMAQLIKRHVDLCFFGVDENDVLDNLKRVLPLCFTRASFPRREPRHCEKLDRFVKLVAEEVTDRVNSRIAVKMNMRYVPREVLPCDGKCIAFTNLYVMIGLVSCLLKCICREKCQCPLTGEGPDMAKTTTPASDRSQEEGKPLKMVIQQGSCQVTYCTSNNEVIEILSDAFKPRAPRFEGDELSGWEDLEAHETEDQPADDKKYRLIILVFVKFLSRALDDASISLDQDSFDRFIKIWSDQALKEIKFGDIIVSPNLKTARTIVRYMFTDITERYPDPRAIMKAILYDPSITKHIIQTLKTHLTVPRPPKENCFCKLAAYLRTSFDEFYFDVITTLGLSRAFAPVISLSLAV